LCLGISPGVCSAGPNNPLPKLDQATGTVEVQWRGKGGPQLGESETKYAFASFAAFPASAVNGPRGEFLYSVLNPDLSLHRTIVVELFAVETDPTVGRAWMAGIVVEDVKSCNGEGGGGSEGGGGHDDSCADDCSDTSHDSTGDDACGGGGGDAGVMTSVEPGGAPLDEGCCGGDEGTTHDDGCAGGGGDSGGGGVSGKNSRVGQFFFAKMQDTGAPGWAEEPDHITWKWFSAEMSEAQLNAMWAAVVSDNKAPGCAPVKLCQKTVLGGNLVVHGAQ
jgi:hypothetical protein